MNTTSYDCFGSIFLSLVYTYMYVRKVFALPCFSNNDRERLHFVRSPLFSVFGRTIFISTHDTRHDDKTLPPRPTLPELPDCDPCSLACDK